MLDMLREGEVFGLLSLIGRNVAQLDVIALKVAFVIARTWQKQISRLEGLKIRSLGDVLRVAKA